MSTSVVQKDTIMVSVNLKTYILWLPHSISQERTAGITMSRDQLKTFPPLQVYISSAEPIWKHKGSFSNGELWDQDLLKCVLLIPKYNQSLKCTLPRCHPPLFLSNPSSLTDFGLLCVFREDLQWPEPVPSLSLGPHQLWLWGAGPDLTKELQRSLKGTHEPQK